MRQTLTDPNRSVLKQNMQTQIEYNTKADWLERENFRLEYVEKYK